MNLSNAPCKDPTPDKRKLPNNLSLTSTLRIMDKVDKFEESINTTPIKIKSKITGCKTPTVKKPTAKKETVLTPSQSS